MPVRNPHFQQGGFLPGEAAHWTLSSLVTQQAIAGFGPLPPAPFESFERWFTHKNHFSQGMLVGAVFDPLGERHEDFEEAWANERYLTELSSGHILAASFAQGAIEDLEAGWHNENFAGQWHQIIAETAVFSSLDYESFEIQWRNNEGYVRHWDLLLEEHARFGGQDLAESFEHSWPLMRTI